MFDSFNLGMRNFKKKKKKFIQIQNRSFNLNWHCKSTKCHTTELVSQIIYKTRPV